MPQIRLASGSPLMVDHYEETDDVDAGSIISIGPANCITHRDILGDAVPVKGAMAWPGGNATYWAELEADAAFDPGDEVWVHPTTLLAGPSGTKFMGYCVGRAVDAGSAVGDTEVEFAHDMATGEAS